MLTKHWHIARVVLPIRVPVAVVSVALVHRVQEVVASAAPGTIVLVKEAMDMASVVPVRRVPVVAGDAVLVTIVPAKEAMDMVSVVPVHHVPVVAEDAVLVTIVPVAVVSVALVRRVQDNNMIRETQIA